MKSKMVMIVSLICMVGMTSLAFAEDVYVTQRGKKYHTKMCRFVKDRETKQLSKEESISKGYQPCPTCYKQELSENADNKILDNQLLGKAQVKEEEKILKKLLKEKK